MEEDKINNMKDNKPSMENNKINNIHNKNSKMLINILQLINRTIISKMIIKNNWIVN
jgi:hypothetical protein